MMVLGLIGEYLGRVFLESKRRPLFILEQVIRDGRPTLVGVRDFHEKRTVDWPVQSTRMSSRTHRTWPPMAGEAGQAGQSSDSPKSSPTRLMSA